MHDRKSMLAIGVAAVALTLGVYPSSGYAAAGSASDPALLSTPAGITLQETGGGRRRGGTDAVVDAGTPVVKPLPGEVVFNYPQYFPGGTSRGPIERVVFANANGFTLYTYDKDVEPGKSSCVDKCAEAWPPALATKGAKTIKDWSIISRVGGAKQWAYKGKPLYTFVKDTAIGQQNGNGAANGVWHALKFAPAADIVMPPGLSSANSEAANAYVLAGKRGEPLYTFEGKLADLKQTCATSTCPDHWIPVAAGSLAASVGDFSVVSHDGIDQWAYKGKPLFTFSGDHSPYDANGVGRDKNYKIAALARYFMPAQAGIRLDDMRGAVLTTASGMTLYRRDTSFHSPASHGLPHMGNGDPKVGRAMGVKSCPSPECTKTWHPLLASANDQPQGFWDIDVRPDGSRQWVYKGFAMYTYVGDKKPGDKTGSDIYDFYVADDPKHDVYEEVGMVLNPTSAVTFWTYAEP